VAGFTSPNEGEMIASPPIIGSDRAAAPGSNGMLPPPPRADGPAPYSSAVCVCVWGGVHGEIRVHPYSLAGTFTPSPNNTHHA
jgi:hypothetical protein